MPPPPPPSPPPGSAPLPTVIAPATSSSDGATTAPAISAAPPASGPAAVVRYTEGFATPESVLYDESADRYLVSNINGKPTDVDNNGYVSELSPDGKVVKNKFIAGGVDKAKLDAPKGLAISQGILYVADLTVVRRFDSKTGAPKGDIPIRGATFLNDVSAGPDGQIYVSDTGIGSEGVAPAGTDAVYAIDKTGKVKPVAKGKDLAGPNGVLATDQGVLVVTARSNEVYRLDKDGTRKDVTKLPEGVLDGIVRVGDHLLISSWKGSAVYRGRLNEKFELAVGGISSPANIGYDSKRGRLLVPRFHDNVVEAYDLQ